MTDPATVQTEPPAPPRKRRAWTNRLSIALGIPQRLVQKMLKWPYAPDWTDEQVEADFDKFEMVWRNWLAYHWPKFRGLRAPVRVEIQSQPTPPIAPESPGVGSAGEAPAPGDALYAERLARTKADRQIAELKLAQMRSELVPRADVSELIRDVLLINASVIRDQPYWLADAMPVEHRPALRAVVRAVEARARDEQRSRVQKRWSEFLAKIKASEKSP